MSDQAERQLPTVEAAPVTSIYGSIKSFEDAQRMASSLAASSLVPTDYKGNTANTLIALEMAHRTGSSPMAVMQNMNVIEGRPSWSSQFVIAALNSCGRFSPLRFRIDDLGEHESLHVASWKDKQTGDRKTKETKVTIRDQRCIAWARDKATGEILEGPPVTIDIAVKEGWYTKPGSKWQTMPDLMIRYRAAKFFGNLYAPDVLMGMHAGDEIEDFTGIEPAPPRAANENSGQVIEGEVITPSATAGKQHPATAAAASRTKKPEQPVTEQKPGQKPESKPEPPAKPAAAPAAATKPKAQPAPTPPAAPAQDEEFF